MMLLKHISIFLAIGAISILMTKKEGIEEFGVALLILDFLYGVGIFGMAIFGAI